MGGEEANKKMKKSFSKDFCCLLVDSINLLRDDDARRIRNRERKTLFFNVFRAQEMAGIFLQRLNFYPLFSQLISISSPLRRDVGRSKTQKASKIAVNYDDSFISKPSLSIAHLLYIFHEVVIFDPFCRKEADEFYLNNYQQFFTTNKNSPILKLLTPKRLQNLLLYLKFLCGTKFNIFSSEIPKKFKQ